MVSFKINTKFIIMSGLLLVSASYIEAKKPLNRQQELLKTIRTGTWYDALKAYDELKQDPLNRQMINHKVIPGFNYSNQSPLEQHRIPKAFRRINTPTKSIYSFDIKAVEDAVKQAGFASLTQFANEYQTPLQKFQTLGQQAIDKDDDDFRTQYTQALQGVNLAANNNTKPQTWKRQQENLYPDFHKFNETQKVYSELKKIYDIFLKINDRQVLTPLRGYMNNTIIKQLTTNWYFEYKVRNQSYKIYNINPNAGNVRPLP